jgi:hypothetical protein
MKRRKLLIGLVALGVSTTPALAQPSGKPPAKAPSKPAVPPPPPPPSGGAAPAKPPAEEVKFGAVVTVLHATNKNKGIDPRIGKMPELGKPPFSSYNSYELVSRAKVALNTTGTNTTLPNRRVLRTTLLEVLPDKEHIKLSASINQPGGRTFLPLLEVKAKTGQSFIVAGQSYKGGILVLHIRVEKQ